MAAERGRGAAVFYIVMGCLFLVQAGVRGVGLIEAVAADASADGLEWLSAIGAIVAAVGFLAYGVLMLRSRRRRIAAFEAEHGVEAGRRPH